MQARHIACPGPTADPPGRLKHHRGEPAHRQPPGRGNTRGTGSDNDHVGVGAHGLQGRLSKRRLVIALRLFCARPSHGRKSTHSSERPCSSFHLSSRRLPSRPRPAIQPSMVLRSKLQELFSRRFVQEVASVICWAHDREGAHRAHELDRERRPRGRRRDGARRRILRPGGRGRAPARPGDRVHRYAAPRSRGTGVSLGAR